MTTTRIRVLSPIDRDQVRFEIGAELDLLPADAEALIACGAAVAVEPVPEQDTSARAEDTKVPAATTDGEGPSANASALSPAEFVSAAPEPGSGEASAPVPPSGAGPTPKKSKGKGA